MAPDAQDPDGAVPVCAPFGQRDTPISNDRAVLVTRAAEKHNDLVPGRSLIDA